MGSRAPADERIVLYNSLASCGLSRAEYPMHVCRLWKGCCVGDEEEEEEGWWSVLLLEGSCSFSSFLLPLLFHVSSLLSPCLGAARPNGHLRYALCPLPSALCPLPSAPCPAALLPSQQAHRAERELLEEPLAQFKDRRVVLGQTCVCNTCWRCVPHSVVITAICACDRLCLRHGRGDALCRRVAHSSSNP